MFDLLFSPSTSVGPCRGAQSEQHTRERRVSSLASPLSSASTHILAYGFRPPQSLSQHPCWGHSGPGQEQKNTPLLYLLTLQPLSLSLWVCAIYACCGKALQGNIHWASRSTLEFPDKVPECCSLAEPVWANSGFLYRVFRSDQISDNLKKVKIRMKNRLFQTHMTLILLWNKQLGRMFMLLFPCSEIA